MMLLLPLVLGILQLALVLHVRNTLAAAAGEGARFAAVAGSSAAMGEAKTRELIAGALSERFTQQVDVRASPVGGAAGFEAVVVADVPILGIGGPGIELRLTGHAVAEQQ